MTVKVVFCAIAALLCCTTLTFANSDPRVPIDHATLSKTCAHYVNRSRFMSRTADAPLEALLADSCQTALHRLSTLYGISPYEGKRARIYLERLTRYKSMIIDMNLASFTQNRQISTQRSADFSFGPATARVSKSGEFLIALHMGLLDVYEDWASVADFETSIAGLSR